MNTRAPDVLISFDDVEFLFESLPLSVEMIAFDGLPLAGKSTLAQRLAQRFGFGYIALDDFMLPRTEWPADIAPAFPFPFVRNQEVEAALRALRDEAFCTYFPYDWEGGWVSPDARYVVRDKPILIEGVGALAPWLTGFYDLRFFVESDHDTILNARRARGDDHPEEEWTALFLPSDDLYLASGARGRADFLVAGRGMIAST